MGAMPTVHETAAQTAKRVRGILKVKFPGVKFSVRSKTYSGGSSVRVHWTDGPRTGSVNQAVQWLEGADFDAMTDSKTYDPPAFVGDEGRLYQVQGADYIFCDRSFSDEGWAKMQRRVCDAFTPEDAAKILNGPDARHWMNKLEAEAEQ